MPARSRICLLLVCLGFVAACDAATPPDTPDISTVVPLDLQVRNSGMPGGYVWLSTIGEPNQSRWHRFGMAEFICVTCPEPIRSVSGYAIAILDESCRLQATYRVDGGSLLVEIDLGPTLRIVEAPPIRDWLPGDSAPVDPAMVPCVPP